MNSKVRYRLSPLSLAMIVGMMSVVGCQPPVAVETYEAEKMGDHRILGGIVRDGDDAYFFEIAGDRESVGELAEPFKKFIDSVKPNGRQPTWTLPTGWTERRETNADLDTVGEIKGEIKQLFATITINNQHRMTVTAPWRWSSSHWSTERLNYVNRWRSELELPRLFAAEALAHPVTKRQAATIPR